MLVGALGFALWRSGWMAGDSATTSSAPSGDLAALEAATRSNPDDLRAWQQLGDARFDARDYGGAVIAYRRVTELAPAVAANWSVLGESLVLASTRDPIPPEALAAFNRAIALDAKDPRARYFLAAKRDIDGDHAGAITAWLALLADTPQGAPWETDVRRTIEQVAERNNIDVASRLAAVRQRALTPEELPVAARAIPGPSRQQMQDASALPKGQQDMMIQGMVDGLEQRLVANPQQVDRWIMLMRSRMTLGESQKAGDALRRAIAANPAAEQRLRAEARLLQVPGA
ncbi:MAG: tetratricopeptide repeat protein [Sphingomonadaceae bacterium]|nr:tetratricopeptide repeat protein [Sphingomonadaceae bacterium]